MRFFCLFCAFGLALCGLSTLALPFGFLHEKFELVFTTSGQNFYNRICSSAVTVRSTVGDTKRPYVRTSPLSISLESSSVTTRFYSDSNCTLEITTATIATGNSTTTFYYLDPSSTSPVEISIGGNAYKPGVQAGSFTENPFVWTGGGTDANWSTSGNWLGGAAPTASDIAVFDGSCSSNCSPILDQNIDVLGIRLNPGYSTSFRQDDYNMTLRGKGLIVMDGTFEGSSNVARGLTLISGVFVARGGTVNLPAGETLTSASWIVGGSAVITVPVGSLLAFRCTPPGPCQYGSNTISPGSETYANFEIRGWETTYNLDNKTLKVGGELKLGDAGFTLRNILSGTIEVNGNVTEVDKGYFGNVWIVLKGNASGQTVTGIGQTGISRLRIDAGTNPVTLTGSIAVNRVEHLSSGTFTTTGSTLTIKCPVTGVQDPYYCYFATVTLIPGSVEWNNVIIDGHATTWSLGGATFNIGGNFSFGDSRNAGPRLLSSGTYEVKGNITSINFGNYGNAQIFAKGNPSGQIISGNTPLGFPQLRIDSGVHPVTLSGAIMALGYQHLSSGTFNVAGSTLLLKCPIVDDTQYGCYFGTINLRPNTVTYNNVSLEGYATRFDLGGQTFKVGGNFATGDFRGSSGGRELNNGTVEVSGNITDLSRGQNGSAVIIAVGGSSTQTITGSTSLGFSHLRVDSGAVAVNLVGTVRTTTWQLLSSGTFTATGSHLVIECPQEMVAVHGCYFGSPVIRSGTVDYNHVTIRGYSTPWDLNGETMKVLGNLSVGDSRGSAGSERRINNGTIEVNGNITEIDSGNIGTALIVAKGSAAVQTITGINQRGFPNLTIDAGANAVTLAGTISTRIYRYLSSGTFTPGASTLAIHCTANTASVPCAFISVSIEPGAVTYNNVLFRGHSTAYDLGAGSFKVGGNLTLGDMRSDSFVQLNNGVVEVSGNLVTTDSGIPNGSAQLQFVGSSASTWSGTSSNLPDGSIVVNKSGGGSITQSRAFSLDGASQSLSLDAGTFNQGGFSLSIGGGLNISAGAVFNQLGASLFYSTLVNNGTLNP